MRRNARSIAPRTASGSGAGGLLARHPQAAAGLPLTGLLRLLRLLAGRLGPARLATGHLRERHLQLADRVAHLRGVLAEGTEDERDPQQLKMAIDGALAILPVVEPVLGQDAGQVRNAISQLQMAYAQMAGGGQAGAEPPSGEQPQPQQPPSSGRLWVPGQ